MNTVQNISKMVVGAGLAALLMTACSKPEEPPSLPPVAPVQKKAEQPPEHSKQATVITTVVPAPVKPAAPVTPAAQPAATEDTVPAVEKAYLNNPDFSERVQNIYKLSELGTPEAVVSLGRLFHQEKDNELKTTILDSLFDIDGQDDRKAVLLSAGTMATETKEVRQSAIDDLGNIDGKYAIPILQALASDPDEDIRESAKDTIELLQSQSALQK